jgi:ACR3 family arsenite efflux pump ArsB
MRLLLTSMMFLIIKLVYAQMPSNIPVDREPVRFFESAENIIFYILIPLLIIVLYRIWRKRIKKNN